MRAICLAILAVFAYKMSDYLKPLAASGAFLLLSILLAVVALVLCIIGL